MRKLWKVTFNFRGGVTTHYTHSASEMAAFNNALGQLAKESGYSSTYNLRQYFLSKPHSYEVKEEKKDGKARSDSNTV